MVHDPAQEIGRAADFSLDRRPVAYSQEIAAYSSVDYDVLSVGVEIIVDVVQTGYVDIVATAKG
jgi:hypothetical protein